MKLGIAREVHEGEKRVAATPDTVQRLRKLGLDILVESGAGEGARIQDEDYEHAGAEIVEGARELWSSSDIVLKIRPPEEHPDEGCHEVDLLPEGGRLICLLYPGHNEELIEKLREKDASVFALDCIPRISRAQSMDVLSSMAGIAGYRAVVEAASLYGRYFSGQITAAGSSDPANVLVIGAGVAGLAAVATAHEMGARVKAFDTREAVREEVESLGGEFLELEFDESGEGEGGYAKQMSDAFLRAEQALFEEEAPHTDIIVTTANIPGKSAPKLITKACVHAMRPGSVIIDLAAETGGNCEATVAGEVVDVDGVRVAGYTDLTSRLAAHASEFFGRNVANLLKLMVEDGEFEVDLEDEVVRGLTVLDEGEMLWPPPKREPTTASPPDREAYEAPPTPAPEPKEERKRGAGTVWALVATAAAMAVIGVFAPAEFVQHFTVFVLACFVGWQVVWNVRPSLHTPLMSVTNAISGIIVVGGVILATADASTVVLALGAGAIFVASINIFGGFLVTQRMLKMFRLGTEEEEETHA